MIDTSVGYSLIGLWGVLMIGIAYFIFRRQNVVDTKEFITAGGRAQVGLTTASFAVTWMWAGDILGVPEYIGFVGVSGIWMYAGPAVLSSFMIFVATEFTLDSVSFIQLLLIGGVGSTALVGPFALSLFWSQTSSSGFITGVVVSQLVTVSLLVVYWFIRQGFGDEGVISGDGFPLEDPALTKQSLGIWGLFFAGIVLLIIVGA